jgi:hypothetical protein
MSDGGSLIGFKRGSNVKGRDLSPPWGLIDEAIGWLGVFYSILNSGRRYFSNIEEGE